MKENGLINIFERLKLNSSDEKNTEFLWGKTDQGRGFVGRK